MMCHLASVTWCATWCALLLTLSCANSTQDTETQHDEPNAMAAAGRGPDNSSNTTEPTWCEARDVLERNCQRCHGAKPSHGAPFALVTYEDTQTSSKKGKVRYRAIADALEGELMPPTYLELEPPVAALGDTDRQLLLAWCEQGAPGDSNDDCADFD